MKKITFICLITLLFTVFCLAGCTMRESSPASPGSTGAPVSSTPEAVATPEPVPTPAPIDLIIGQSSPSYVIPADLDQAVAAVRELIGKQGQTLWESHGSWYTEDAVETRITGTRAGESSAIGDIMASDGEYLYLLAGKELVIVRLDADDAAVVSRTKVGADWSAWEDTADRSVNGSEKIPSSVFCLGDRLAVVYDYYVYTTKNGDIGYTEYTALEVFDVSDPASPVKTAELGQDGEPLAAGFMSGSFYLVTAMHCETAADGGDITSLIPASYTDGTGTALSPDKLLAAADGRTALCSVVGVYDLTSGSMSDARALYGSEAGPYVGESEFLFCVPRVAEGFSRSYKSPEYGAATEYAAAACTDLYRFSLAEGTLSFDRVSTIEGVVDDPSCLDSSGGILRCAGIKEERRRTDYESGRHSISSFYSCDIQLLDASLNVVGTLNDLTDGAPNCWIGYLGDRAVVTQQEGSSRLALLADPEALDVVTLPDVVRAQSIRSLGEIGYTAFYRSEAGKLTLTVYDADMTPVCERTFGSDHSSTLENQAGYFADGEANVIAFSADDSYCVYGFDPDQGLVLRGDVFLTDWAWNARGFCLDGLLYVADTKEVCIYDLSDFSCLKQLSF